MTLRPAIVHLTSREGLSSVFMSQVARPMSCVRDRGYAVTLAVMSPLGEFIRPRLVERWRVRRKEIACEFGSELCHFPSAPSRMSKSWNDALLLRAWLKLHFPHGKHVILHCRGTEATHAALQARARDGRVSVVADCRGLEAPEYLLYQGYHGPEAAPHAVQRTYQNRAEAQRAALIGSDAVICVSDAMRKEIALTWQIAMARIGVVPCCADMAAGQRAASLRAQTRGSLGVQDRFVVAYCGSTAPWQMLRETLAAFREIAAIRGDAHFLAITTDPSGVARTADQCGVASTQRTVINLPHARVATYLAAADLGLLLRDGSIVNRVASPVKFGEYLACGVPVMITEGIGDYSALVRHQGLGCVLASAAVDGPALESMRGFLAAYDRDSSRIRYRCLSVARSTLSWDAAIGPLCDVYQQLSSVHAHRSLDAMIA